MRLFVCVLALFGPLFAQPTLTDLLEQQTVGKVRSQAESLDGLLGFAALDLKTGRTFHLNGDTVFPQASSIKIPILAAIFEASRAGKFALDDSVTLTAKDAVGGSGTLGEAVKGGAVTLSVRDLLRAMIRASDNTATNKCIEMAGMESVNIGMERLGLRSTRLRRRMMDGAAARRGEENVSTPLQMVRLLQLLYEEKLVDPAASREMQEILKLVKDEMRKAVPPEYEVASKPGSLDGVRCESGIVYLSGRPFALSVMASFLAGDRNPVGEVTAVVFAHFWKLAASNEFGNRLP
jgi:beta-lactamase class A